MASHPEGYPRPPIAGLVYFVDCFLVVFWNEYGYFRFASTLVPLVHVCFGSSSDGATTSFARSVRSLLAAPSTVPLDSLRVAMPFYSLGLLVVHLTLYVIFYKFLLVVPGAFVTPVVTPRITSVLPPVPATGPYMEFLAISSSDPTYSRCMRTATYTRLWPRVFL